MGVLDIFTKGAKNRELIKTGKILINNRAYSEAVSVVTKVLDVKPNNYEALITRARAYCYLEEYDEAIEDLNRSIEINSLCSSGHFYRGQLNIIKGNLYDAIEDFNKVLRIEKRNFVAYLKRGSIYSKLGMYDAAVNNFKALVRIKKRDTKYYDLLLSACLAAKNYSDIEKYAQKLIKLDDGNFKGYYYLGRMHAARDNNKEAVKCFSDALRRGGSTLDCRYHRGMSYVYLGEYSEAIVDFTLAIGLLTEGGGEFYFSRGYSYLKLNEFDKAIDDFNKCIELGHNIESSYYNKGAAYIKLQDYKSGVETLSKLLEIEKTFDGAYYDRAFCYKNLKEYEKAISDYNKAIELNPKVEGFYYELARLYFEIDEYDNVIKILDDAEKNVKGWSYKTFSYTLKGDIYLNEKEDIKEAIENYTKSIRVSPTAYAYVQRGKAHKQLKEYNIAMEDFNRAIEIENDNHRAYYYKGYINFINNNYSEALKDLDASVSIKETSDALILRGRCLVNGKRLSEAISDYTKVIERDFNNGDAYIYRAEALKDLSMYEDAIKDYKKASLINKEYTSNAYLNIGIILAFEGKSKQAIYYYTKAIESDVLNYIAYLKRSEELIKLEEVDDAIRDIENAILKLSKEESYYDDFKEDIEKLLVIISEKTINEQLKEKIARILGELEG